MNIRKQLQRQKRNMRSLKDARSNSIEQHRAQRLPKGGPKTRRDPNNLSTWPGPQNSQGKKSDGPETLRIVEYQSGGLENGRHTPAHIWLAPRIGRRISVIPRLPFCQFLAKLVTLVVLVVV